jgi:hypothetical protein
MPKKRISPALFATIVATPIVALQLGLVAIGVWAFSPELISVVVVDAIFWLLCLFIWQQTGLRRNG